MDNRRIQHRYVSRVGAGGGLLAIALIAFVSLTGVVSLVFWPQSGGNPAPESSATLIPSRSAGQHAEGATRTSSPAIEAKRGSSEAPGGGPAATSGGDGHKASKPATLVSKPARRPAPGGSPQTRVGVSHPHGNANGQGNGNANGQGNGNANGQGNGIASGQAIGNANGQGNGNANGQGNGNSGK